MDNKTFEIKIHVRSEDELYNPFDEEHLTVSDDVASYILDKNSEKSLGEQLVLNVHSDSAFDRDNFETAVKRHLDARMDQLSRDLRMNMIKATRLLIIGLIFVAAGILLSIKLNEVALAIISTIGSFSIWEAANIWIVKNPEIRMDKKRLEWLKKLKVIDS